MIGATLMTDPKRLVVLTDDNWRDYFAFIVPATIIDGLTIPANGIDRDGPEVTRLLAGCHDRSFGRA
jgi:hypothetical protein